MNSNDRQSVRLFILYLLQRVFTNVENCAPRNTYSIKYNENHIVLEVKILNHDDKNIEQNDPNGQTVAHLEELTEIGKTMIKIGDSISVDLSFLALEGSQNKIEIDNMQKQIHYLTTEFEKLKKASK